MGIDRQTQVSLLDSHDCLSAKQSASIYPESMSGQSLQRPISNSRQLSSRKSPSSLPGIWGALHASRLILRYGYRLSLLTRL